MYRIKLDIPATIMCMDNPVHTETITYYSNEIEGVQYVQQMADDINADFSELTASVEEKQSDGTWKNVMSPIGVNKHG